MDEKTVPPAAPPPLLPPDGKLAVEDMLFGTCPSCGDEFIVPRRELNCTIFRHAAFKNTQEPIPSHTSKEECEKLLKDGAIYGCGAAFKFDGKTAVTCDYSL